MKKLQLAVFIGFAALLSGCACECADDYFAMMQIELRNFSPRELKTVYIVDQSGQNVCTNCIDFQGKGVLNVGPNSQYQIKSDSIPLNKVIRVNEIRSETTKSLACECTSITGIDYEYEGSSYTNEPVIITK
jgi:hypothetical protein